MCLFPFAMIKYCQGSSREKGFASAHSSNLQSIIMVLRARHQDLKTTGHAAPTIRDWKLMKHWLGSLFPLCLVQKHSSEDRAALSGWKFTSSNNQLKTRFSKIMRVLLMRYVLRLISNLVKLKHPTINPSPQSSY